MAVDGAQIQDKGERPLVGDGGARNRGGGGGSLTGRSVDGSGIGTNLRYLPKRGELVGAGMPIMNLVVLDDVHVVLNVREDRLPLFKMGGTFVADVPAIDKKDIEFKINIYQSVGQFRYLEIYQADR